MIVKFAINDCEPSSGEITQRPQKILYRRELLTRHRNIHVTNYNSFDNKRWKFIDPKDFFPSIFHASEMHGNIEKLNKIIEEILSYVAPANLMFYYKKVSFNTLAISNSSIKRMKIPLLWMSAAGRKLFMLANKFQLRSSRAAKYMFAS